MHGRVCTWIFARLPLPRKCCCSREPCPWPKCPWPWDAIQVPSGYELLWTNWGPQIKSGNSQPWYHQTSGMGAHRGAASSGLIHSPPTFLPPAAGDRWLYRSLFQDRQKHVFAGVSEPQTGRKYPQCIHLAVDSHPEYIKVSYNLTIKRQLHKKWAKTWVSTLEKNIQEWLNRRIKGVPHH